MIAAAPWMLTIAAVVAVERATAGTAPLLRMGAIIGVLFAGMKLVVAFAWMRQTGGRLPLRRWAAFGAWPGMRPGDFAVRQNPPRPLEAGPGWRALAAGALLMWIAGAVVEHSRPAALLLALPALSLILHFGIFRLLAVFWRARGFDVAVPFDAPLRSTSLGEFWSRRWNRPFSDMTALLVYRPMKRVFGTGVALSAAFLVSGVLHELAISVPVGAGYGGPLGYFVLHGVLVAAERRRLLDGRPRWLGRLWTVSALVVPLPLLFHRAFLEGVVLAVL